MKTMTGKNEDFAFSSCIDIPVSRSSKPRTVGLNFSGDWGRSLSELEGIMETRGEYIDSVKLAVLSGRLYTKEYIKKKIELYRKHNVDIFPGGMTLEAALVNKKVDEFFSECEDMGFTEIEVSESEITITPETRMKLIERGVKEGYKVQVEFGAHFAKCALPINHTIHLSKQVLDAGAFKVCLEGDAIKHMKPWEDSAAADKVHTLIDQIGIDNLVFEIAGDQKLAQWFILNYGPDVSFGNVPFEMVIQIEHVRRGMNISPTWFGKFAAL
jgi:phosphosulfolactate synthase